MTLRIGLVGTGWFGKVHADILARTEGVRLAAVCGTSREKAEAFASAYPGAAGYGDPVAMLDGERLDAVYICVPPFAHGELELQLIERGIPFLTEKPLGVGLDGPLAVAARLRERPVVTSVGYHHRYRDSVRALKERLAAGGTLGMVDGGWMGGFVNNAWWPKQERSGGQFVEQTTHWADLLRYAAGEAVEVYAAFGARAVRDKYPHADVHDVGTVVVKLASGAVASLSNTCLLPPGVSKRGMTFYTDQGMLELGMNRLELVEEGDRRTVWTDEANPYEAETAAFVRAVKTGDTSGILSDYEDAVRTQRLTAAALESARTGRPVRLAD